MKRVLGGMILSSIGLWSSNIALEGPFSFYEAQKACKNIGNGFRTMEIYELFALRDLPATFEKDTSFWSATVLHKSRKDPTKKIDEEFHLEEQKLPAFTYYFKDGDITVSPKSKETKVLCTNDPRRKKPFDQFEKKESGSVVDHQFLIEWEPLTKEDKKKRLNYIKAISYCESKQTLGGNWRLPELDEMYSIINYDYSDPATDKDIFGMMVFKYYWVEDELDEDEAYVVGMRVGSVATSNKSNKSFVRCVRDIE
ncbi:MAG: DUF1566 domain-containing protein [Epsilonproteobacteria bacterium]|nr:DUF1566 domain-containing protein [Campylobacterota bacterium]